MIRKRPVTILPMPCDLCARPEDNYNCPYFYPRTPFTCGAFTKVKPLPKPKKEED